jgi:nucleotide-binding universal stress UspA family protein
MEVMKRILAPMDFSEASREALRYALFLAQRFHAHLEVLHVWEPSPYVSPSALVWLQGEQQSFWSHVERDLSQRLRVWVAEVAEAETPRVTMHVQAGYTSQTILQAADKGEFDLIVMGTHGRSGLSHLLLGSVAQRVVRLAPCPVLTVRSQRADPASRPGASRPGASTPPPSA